MRTTVDLHNYLITIGQLDVTDLVFYASTGPMEFLEVKYPETVICVIDPSIIDPSLWKVQVNKVPFLKVFPDSMIAKAVIHNYPGFRIFDYSKEAIIVRKEKKTVFAKFLPSEVKWEKEKAEELFDRDVIMLTETIARI